MRRDDLRGSKLTITQFRMRVQITAPLDQLIIDTHNAFIDASIKGHGAYFIRLLCLGCLNGANGAQSQQLPHHRSTPMLPKG